MVSLSLFSALLLLAAVVVVVAVLVVLAISVAARGGRGQMEVEFAVRS